MHIVRLCPTDIHTGQFSAAVEFAQVLPEMVFTTERALGLGPCGADVELVQFDVGH